MRCGPVYLIHPTSLTQAAWSLLAQRDTVIGTTAKRHDVTAISVGDRREMELPPIGILELEDAETGETILIDTYDTNTTRGFRLLAGEDRDERSNFLRSAGVGEVRIRADEKDYVDPLVRYFHFRETRR